MHQSMAMHILFLVMLIMSSHSIDSVAASCPIDFGYVKDFQWASHLCQNTSTENCCHAVVSTFGIGFSLFVNQTGSFSLPDNNTALECLDRYREELLLYGLPSSFPMLPCFQGPNSPFNASCLFIDQAFPMTLCQRQIHTTADFRAAVGSTEMDSSCTADLSVSAACQDCRSDASDAYSKLTQSQNGSSCCFYISFVFPAGVLNPAGPKDPSVARCLLGVEQWSYTTTSLNHVVVPLVVGASVAIVISILMVLGIWLWLWQRRNPLPHASLLPERYQGRLRLLLRVSSLLSRFPIGGRGLTGYQIFCYGEIQAATSNFSLDNRIGEGGFSIVYKAVLADGTPLAVKQFKGFSSLTNEQLLNEVESIQKVRHRNLLTLRGSCFSVNHGQVETLLIYDYMANGTLHDHLGFARPPLQWQARQKIALGIAKGLAYLHEGLNTPMIHRDIKPNNILLDEKLEAKLADFGLARMLELGVTHVTTKVAGTRGYVAPEYAIYGRLTEKSDVYSYGVVLLELMSGKRAVEFSPSRNNEVFLISDWAWQLAKEGKVGDIIDPTMKTTVGNDEEWKVMERYVMVGIVCAHLMVACRPSISQALKMLTGDAPLPNIPDRPLPLNMEEHGLSPSTSTFSPTTKMGLSSASLSSSISTTQTNASFIYSYDCHILTKLQR